MIDVVLDQSKHPDQHYLSDKAGDIAGRSFTDVPNRTLAIPYLILLVEDLCLAYFAE